MTKTRTSRRPVRGGLVQAEVGIVGMAVVTLLVSLVAVSTLSVVSLSSWLNQRPR